MLKMPKREEKQEADFESEKKIAKLLILDQARVEILDEIADKIEDLVSEQALLEEDNDAAGSLGTKLRDIFEPILEELKEFVQENEEKKSFVSGLVKIFPILLSAKCSSLAKIKKIVKTSAEIAINLWPEQKQQYEGYLDLALFLLHARALATKTY